MINFGIVDNENAQQVYYLLKSIKKNCKFDYTITLIECSKKNPIKNVIDGVTKYVCKYEDANKILREKITENLCILNPNILIKKDFRIEDVSEPFIFGENCYFLPRTDEFKEYKKTLDLLVEIWDKESNYIDWLYKHEHDWKFYYEDFIVSMTTWHKRINDNATYEALDSFVNQKCDYNYKVMIVLAEEEFGKEVPVRMKDFVESHKDKVEILWTYKDTRPLKKLDPTIEKYPECPIVTLDDDDILDENDLQKLYIQHMEDPWSVYGSMIDNCYGIEHFDYVCKWVANCRIWPPHCLYNFPLNDFYEYFGGILDDNFNAVRCLYKMTPVKEIKNIQSHKKNDSEIKLTYEYADTDWPNLYSNFIMQHLEELPSDLLYE